MSEMQNPADPAPQEVILEMAFAYFLSSAIQVTAELGIADHLADGPKQIDELATATGTHQPSLYRLLRMLAGHGVFREDTPGRFQLTPLAEPLQTGVPGSVRDAARMGGETWWNAAGSLLHSV